MCRTRKQINLNCLNKKIVLVIPLLLYVLFKAYFGRELREYKDDQLETLTTWSYYCFRAPDVPNAYCFGLKSLIRAAIRSSYQVLNVRSRTIGLFELLVFILRETVLLDLEKSLLEHKFALIHGAVLEKNGRVIVISGPSGSGKSTFASALVNCGWERLSDNYAFFNGKEALVVPECARFGLPKRFEISFYGKGVHETAPAALRPISEIYLLQLNFEQDTFTTEKLSQSSAFRVMQAIVINENEGLVSADRSAYFENFSQIKKTISVDSYLITHRANLNDTQNLVENYFGF